MSSNRDVLVNELTAMPLLDGRFSDISCVNYDPVDDKKRGNFSLVFKCKDNLTGKHAALKFYDPEQLGELYRIQAFMREPDILSKLLGKRRCLQLVQGLKPVPINISTPIGPFRIDCNYYAVQWIDEDIDEYFQQQHLYDAAIKLDVFVDIVLAVEALHKCGIYHRDLKTDNFRAYIDTADRIIVAVDMGTAARYDTAPSITPTNCAVGAHGYSSPEALCGLARNRKIARFTDIYALGCLLYELFNREMFFCEQYKNPSYQRTLAALAIEQTKCRNDDEKESAWCSSISSLKRGVSIPPIIGAGSSAPLSIGSELNYILKSLVSFDYRDRCDDLNKVRERINGVKRVINHTAWDARRRKENKLRREQRIKKQAERILSVLRANKKKEPLPC